MKLIVLVDPRAMDMLFLRYICKVTIQHLLSCDVTKISNVIVVLKKRLSDLKNSKITNVKNNQEH